MAHGETSSRGRRRHVRYLLYSVRYFENDENTKILKWDLNRQEIHKNISSVVLQEDSICISSNVHLLEHQITSDHSLIAFIHPAYVLCACSHK